MIDSTQTLVWYGSLLAKSGKTASELRTLIADEAAKRDLHEVVELTSLERYEQGTQSPSRSRGPDADGPWLRIAESLWPGTRRWFDTPVWYLLKQESITYQQLLDCAQRLPRPLRDEFFWNPDEAGPSALTWSPITRSTIYGLVEQVDLWEFGPGCLGALACAMRESELRGESGMVRWSAVGLAWVITELQQKTHIAMRSGLLQIRFFVDEYLHRMGRPGILLGNPVSDKEVLRFSKERQAYIEYFAAGDFSHLEFSDVAPWLRVD